ISSASNETQREIIERLRDSEFNVESILLRDRRSRYLYSGKIQPFVCADQAAVQHARSYFRRADFHCDQLDETVVDEYPIPLMNVGRDMIVGDRNFAGALPALVNEHDILALLQ